MPDSLGGYGVCKGVECVGREVDCGEYDDPLPTVLSMMTLYLLSLCDDPVPVTV